MVEEMISSPGAFIFSVHKNKCNGAELRSVRPNRAKSSAPSFSLIEGEPKASTTSSLPGRIGSATAGSAGKERAMRTVRLLFCVLALAFVSTQALPQEAPAPKKITIIGKLTRVMAIGGEN